MVSSYRGWLAAVAGALLSSSVASAGPTQPLSSIPASHLFSKLDPAVWKEKCVAHSAPTQNLVSGPVELVTPTTQDHPMLPRIPVMNETAWEQWIFLTTSDDGSASMLLGIVRDPFYRMLSDQSLQIHMFFAGPEGRIQQVFFPHESVVYDCGDHLGSHWVSSHPAVDLQFAVDRSLTSAVVRYDSAKFRANFTFAATAPAHHADGSPLGSDVAPASDPSTPRSMQSPGFHLFNAIAGAQVDGDVEMRGRPLSSHFGGNGIMLRAWAADYWLSIVDDFRIVQGSAGPFTFFVWDSTSRWAPEGGEAVFMTGVLRRGDKQLVGSRRSDPAAKIEGQDYVRLVPMYGPHGLRGKVGGGLSTGHILEFYSAQEKRTWRFEMEHSVLSGNMNLGAGHGTDIWGSRVWGGEVGEDGTVVCGHRGSAVTEDASFPLEVPDWQVKLLFLLLKVQQAWEQAKTMVLRFVSERTEL